MKSICNKLSLLLIAFGLTLFACEDEFEVVRSKNLNVYGSTEVFVGDIETYEAPLFVLNDTRTWQWSATFNGVEVATGTGEFFDLDIEEEGTYTIILTESDRTGSIQVDASFEELE